MGVNTLDDYLRIRLRGKKYFPQNLSTTNYVIIVHESRSSASTRFALDYYVI